MAKTAAYSYTQTILIMNNHISLLKHQLLKRENFRFAKLYTTLISIPEQFLKSDDKIVLSLFIALLGTDETSTVTEIDIDHKEIATLTGLSHTKIKKIMAVLPKKITVTVKHGLLANGENLVLSINTVKGYKSIFHFEYSEPRRRQILKGTEYKQQTAGPLKQERLLKLAELGRLKDYFDISVIEHYADLYNLERIKHSVDYYLFVLAKKLDKDKSAALDENYLAGIFTHPQWYQGMLSDRQKLYKYIDFLKEVNSYIADAVKTKKYPTKINFANFDKIVTTNGQIKLSYIKDIKYFKQLLRGNLKGLQNSDYERLKNLTQFAFNEIKYFSVFGGRNHNSIKEDIQLALLQSGYSTVNIND